MKIIVIWLWTCVALQLWHCNYFNSISNICNLPEQSNGLQISNDSIETKYWSITLGCIYNDYSYKLKNTYKDYLTANVHLKKL